MSFFIATCKVEDQMVLGMRESTSKAGKPFIALSVADSEGNSNQFSCSDPDNMQACRALQQGDKVDLLLVVAGGPNKQYAMIKRVPGAVMPSKSYGKSSDVGY